MTFDFYYKNDEERKELENIVCIEAKNHFGEKEHEDEKGLPVGNWTADVYAEYKFFRINIKNDAYISDLQKSKESVYKQNMKNSWHNLKENPKDLPDDDRKVLIKIDSDHQTTVIGRCEMDGRWFLPTIGYTNNTVSDWRELEADEILLTDFLSDVSEYLSFVPTLEIK